MSLRSSPSFAQHIPMAFYVFCVFQSSYRDCKVLYDLPFTHFLDSFLSLLPAYSLHYSYPDSQSPSNMPSTSHFLFTLPRTLFPLDTLRDHFHLAFRSMFRFQLIKQPLLESQSKKTVSLHSLLYST